MNDKHKGLSKSSKKNKFTIPMTCDDRAWPTEKRLEWGERSKQTNEQIDSKHATKPSTKPQDAFCVGKWIHII